MRQITEAQIRAIRQILVEESGMPPEDHYCSFVRAIMIAEPRLACTEYRFMGALRRQVQKLERHPLRRLLSGKRNTGTVEDD